MNEELAIKHAAAIAAHLGSPGRMIAWSKGDYQDRRPDHVVVYNSNVCLPGGKVWWGDIDLTLDEAGLVGLAAETGETVYLLHEWDARFATEDRPLLDDAVYSVNPAGETRFDRARISRRRRGRALVLRPSNDKSGGHPGAEDVDERERT